MAKLGWNVNSRDSLLSVLHFTRWFRSYGAQCSIFSLTFEEKWVFEMLVIVSLVMLWYRDRLPVKWFVRSVVGMRSGLPSSSSPFVVKVAIIGCWGCFGLDGVAVACRLHRAIRTPVTMRPSPVAVPPRPIKIGDISTEDTGADSPWRLRNTKSQECYTYWIKTKENVCCPYSGSRSSFVCGLSIFTGGTRFFFCRRYKTGKEGDEFNEVDGSLVRKNRFRNGLVQ